MADLSEIVTFLDRELKTSEIRDYPGALNGLQLENDGTVKRVISAVDASLAVIEEAAKEGDLERVDPAVSQQPDQGVLHCGHRGRGEHQQDRLLHWTKWCSLHHGCGGSGLYLVVNSYKV